MGGEDGTGCGSCVQGPQPRDSTTVGPSEDGSAFEDLLPELGSNITKYGGRFLGHGALGALKGEDDRLERN